LRFSWFLDFRDGIDTRLNVETVAIYHFNVMVAFKRAIPSVSLQFVISQGEGQIQERPK
jgi:hypothetical protein